MAANLELSESLATVTAFANNPDNIRAVHIAILGSLYSLLHSTQRGFRIWIKRGWLILLWKKNSRSPFINMTLTKLFLFAKIRAVNIICGELRRYLCLLLSSPSQSPWIAQFVVGSLSLNVGNFGLYLSHRFRRKVLILAPTSWWCVFFLFFLSCYLDSQVQCRSVFERSGIVPLALNFLTLLIF